MFVVDIEADRVVAASEQALAWRPDLCETPPSSLFGAEWSHVCSGRRVVVIAADEGVNHRAHRLRSGTPAEDGTCVVIVEGRDEIRSERERIARDLHDGVVQEVIATSMSLAAVVPFLDGEVRERVEDLIDVQDVIVRRLRSTLFALEGSTRGRTDAHGVFSDVLTGAERGLGFAPTLTVVGPVAALADSAAFPHLVLAMRECLSNAARHARARSVAVSVEIAEGFVVLTVADDGCGLPVDAVPGRGMRNLHERAVELGGMCSIRPSKQWSTVVRWQVPLGGPAIERIDVARGQVENTLEEVTK
jgi:signal transduction histidine kinase